MKKIILLMLAIAMILSTVSMAACSNQKDNGEDTTTGNIDPSGENTQVIEETTPAPYTELDKLPEMDYGGADIPILVWKSSENEYFAESDTGETIDSAIFNRNLKVESRMNCHLQYEMIPGASGDGNTYIGKIQNNIMAGDAGFDLIAAYARHGMTCAVRGLMTDISESEYIDWDATWYKKAVINASSIGNKLFMFAGDISHSSIARVSGVFFNVDLINSFGLEDPYQLVLDNKWYMTKFIEMLQGLYSDTDGSGTKTKGDMFGVVSDNIMMDCAQYAGGLKFCVKDENDIPVLSPDITGEKVIKLIDLWIQAMDASGFGVSNDDTSVWVAGQTVFYLYPLAYVRNEKWKTLDYTYGFVPQPKGEETQENYIGSLTNYFSLWGIPTLVKDQDRCEMLVECLSSEGYHYITPAVFETAYKYKYSSDETMRQSEIFDIIRENTYCDFGKICANSLGELPNHLFSDTVLSGYNNFKSKLTASQRKLTKQLQSIVDGVDAG